MASGSVEPIAAATKVITKPDQSVVLQVRRAQLKVIAGPDKGQLKELGHLGLVVGKSSDCGFVLSDSSVSRRHFELRPDASGFLLRDLGSKNGTSVSGLVVRDATLAGGEKISLGQSQLQFATLKGHAEHALSASTSFGALIGRSPVMRNAFALLERAAESDSTVLLEGESGTGKELAAEAIHAHSSRREGPFVVVDCAAMQPSLMESELFGHRKGAFTGAAGDRVGAFEAADGGTLLLDEIGEVDPALQPKLLRFLENRQFKRLGDNQHRRAEVRLVAATNRDLQSEVRAGRFREDLYYRVSVLRLRLPPLRDRHEDLGLLAKSFIQGLNPRLDPAEVINEQVLALLMSHQWPGNVRELRNVVERLIVFSDRPEAALAPMSAFGEGHDDPAEALRLTFNEARRRWVDGFERRYLQAALDTCDGVVSRACTQAGIPRQTFYRLMAKHGLSR